MKNHIEKLWFCFAGLVLAMLAQNVIAETLYVDSRGGNDANTGTKEKPLRTIKQAALSNVLEPGNAGVIVSGQKPFDT